VEEEGGSLVTLYEFLRRDVTENNDDEDRSPGGGDKSIAMVEGRGGKGINPHSPPAKMRIF
jgi:hypothetical protein